MGKYDNYIGRVYADRYEIINVIGTGGSAVVFGVYDSKDDRTVAMKMLRHDCENNEESVKRFEQEAELLSLFSHPGIVKIYDKYLDGFPKYFIMEYVEGITLKKHILSHGAMTQEEIFYFLKPILSALGEIHKKGVVHSDIKPQNIVVLSDGSIRIMDFGISKSFPEDFEETKQDNEESTDMAVGTVHYVSPEQAEAKKLDGRSDLYSLGVVTYEMATGILPFFGDKASKIAAMHVNELPIAPTIVNPAVSDEVEEIILRALEKLPKERYQTAREMLDDIERAENPPPPSNEPLPIKERIKDYFINFNIPSGIMGGLCALLVCLVMGLGILSVNVLDERNLHEHIRVPKLMGTPYSQIEYLGLDEDIYQIEVVYKENDRKSGQIIDQIPTGDKIVKLDKDGKCKITITVAQFPMPDTVPDVTAINADEAEAILNSYGYEVDTVTAPHSFIPEGRVIYTMPKAGEASEEKIMIFKSSGYSD